MPLVVGKDVSQSLCNHAGLIIAANLCISTFVSDVQYQHISGTY